MATRTRFVFHGSLRDFLPKAHHQGVEVHLQERQSVKHVIQALGVPHPEVARVECQGRSWDWNQPVPDGVEIHVYPYPPGTAWPYPQAPKFVLDGHLGRLTAYLRLLGFDVLYHPEWDDPWLAELAAREERILLTRDQGLLKRNEIQFGYWVRSLHPPAQLREVARYFGLRRWVRPFRRCAKCNTLLEVVPRTRVLGLVPEDVHRRFSEFHQCPQCRRVYWRGSHVDRLLRLFREALGDLEDSR